MKKHKRRELKVIPKSVPRIQPAVVFRADEGIGGNEDEDLICGECGGFIAIGVRPATFARQFANAREILIECNSCGAYNDIPVPSAK